MLACFLLVHNRMAQVKANKTKANAKGFVGSFNENNPEIKARSQGGAPGVQGGGEETLWESWLAPGTC